jgi:hypothetical protein
VTVGIEVFNLLLKRGLTEIQTLGGYPIAMRLSGHQQWDEVPAASRGILQAQIQAGAVVPDASSEAAEVDRLLSAPRDPQPASRSAADRLAHAAGILRGDDAPTTPRRPAPRASPRTPSSHPEVNRLAELANKIPAQPARRRHGGPGRAGD